MALTESEGTRSDSLVKARKLMQAAFPVGYIQIESWYVNPQDPSFTAILRLFYNEDLRRADAESAYRYSIGCTLQASDFDRMSSVDDRKHLYPMIEYLIHYQLAGKEVGQGKVDKEKVEQELKALREELGVETVFTEIGEAEDAESSPPQRE